MTVPAELAILNQGWVGSTIGLIGIALAVWIYRRSRLRPLPCYQVYSNRLLGVDNQELPPEIEIVYEGSPIPRVTRAYIVFWNAGNATLNGQDLVLDDPLRLELDDGAVLTAQIVRTTREVNRFKLPAVEGHSSAIPFTFEYLDPEDGAVIEVLHTGTTPRPTVRGSIRGIPKGVTLLSPDLPLLATAAFRALRVERARGFLVVPLVVMLITGLAAVIAALLPDGEIREFVREQVFGDLPPTTSAGSRWLFVLLGAVYAALPAYFLWILRKRFPKSLSLPQ